MQRFNTGDKLLILSITILFCLPTLETRRTHSSHRNPISTSDSQKNYVACLEDSTKKHGNFSYPGKEIICNNLKNLTNYDVIAPIKKKDKIRVTQFISVQGSLGKRLLENYANTRTILIYKSHINNFSLTCDNNQELVIAESVFPTVTKDIFQNAKSIHFLGLYSNPGLILADECFLNLNHLLSLTLYNQLLPNLTTTTFKGLRKLNRLVLVDVELSQIDKNAFEHTRHLQELILDNNPLEQFVVDYTQLKYLRKLSLFNTNLKKLNLPLFSNMKYLHTLGIPNQALSKITLLELAVSYPHLETVMINHDEFGNEYLRELLEDIEAAGLVVEKVNKPSELQNSIYEEDMKFLSWQ